MFFIEYSEWKKWQTKDDDDDGLLAVYSGSLSIHIKCYNYVSLPLMFSLSIVFSSSVDVRDKSSEQLRPKHWSDPEVFGLRANFSIDNKPESLVIKVSFFRVCSTLSATKLGMENPFPSYLEHVAMLLLVYNKNFLMNSTLYTCFRSCCKTSNEITF